MRLLLRSELFRLSRRWMPRILLVIVNGIVVLIYSINWVVVQTQDEADVSNVLENFRIAAVLDTGLGLVFQMGTIVVVILAASSIGAEYGWGTIRAMVPRARSRTAFLTAKLITLLSFIALIVLKGFVVALGSSALVTVLADLDRSVPESFVWQPVASMGRTAFVMLPYLALAFLVALWSRSNAAGISVGLAVFFLELPLLFLVTAAGGPFERISEFLLVENLQAVLAANPAASEDPGPSDGLPRLWQATAVLAAYTVVFVALAYRIFLRRDVASG